jgi:hypothetical protein
MEKETDGEMEKKIVVNLTYKHGGEFALEDREGQEYFVSAGDLANLGIDYNAAETGDEFIAIVNVEDSEEVVERVEEIPTHVGGDLFKSITAPKRTRIVKQASQRTVRTIVALQVVQSDDIVHDATYEVHVRFNDRTKRPHDWALITGTGPDKLVDRAFIANGGLVLTISTKSLPEAMRLQRMILEFADNRWKKDMTRPQVFLRSLVTIRKSFLIDQTLIEQARRLSDAPVNLLAESFGISVEPTRMVLPPIAVEAQRLPAAPEEPARRVLRPTQRLDAAIDVPTTAIDVPEVAFDDVPQVEETPALREGYVQEEMGNLIEILQDGGGSQSLDDLRLNLGLSNVVLRAVLDRAIAGGRVREDNEGRVQLA